MDIRKSFYMIAMVAGFNCMVPDRVFAGGPRKSESVDQIEKLLPITASGVAKAHELVAIKSKSSGRVENVCIEEGEMVRAGAVLVQLESVDEQRNYERLKAELDRVKAYLEQSVIRLRDAKQNRPMDIEVQERIVEEARAAWDEKKMDVDRLRDLMPDLKSPTEDRRAAIALDRAAAVLAREEAALRRTCNTLPILIATAEQDVAANEAWLRSVQGQLDEAKARLDETVILSPIAGIVCNINVRRGEVIQGGMYGIDGGTALLKVADVSTMSVAARVEAADISAVRHISPAYAQPGTARVVTEKELFGPEQIDAAANSTLRRVKVVADAYPGEIFEGVIERLIPEPRTACEGGSILNVRIRLRGLDLAKLLGMEVQVNFPADRRLNVLRVKTDALHHEGQNVFVTVPFLEPSSNVEREKKVRVQIGPTDGEYTEIVSGLASGDRVYVNASEPPKPIVESSVAPPPAKITPPAAPPVITAVDVSK